MVLKVILQCNFFHKKGPIKLVRKGGFRFFGLTMAHFKLNDVWLKPVTRYAIVLFFILFEKTTTVELHRHLFKDSLVCPV